MFGILLQWALWVVYFPLQGPMHPDAILLLKPSSHAVHVDYNFKCQSMSPFPEPSCHTIHMVSVGGACHPTDRDADPVLHFTTGKLVV